MAGTDDPRPIAIQSRQKKFEMCSLMSRLYRLLCNLFLRSHVVGLKRQRKTDYHRSCRKRPSLFSSH